MAGINLNTHHIHFIGAGGIGMSGLALILKQQGYHVSGCDTGSSEQKEKLKMLGCPIYDTHDSLHITHDCDLVVYSSNIPLNSAELEQARKEKKRIIHRGELLALVLKNFQHNISITGTHGKTTTTSLVSHIFSDTQYDPTIICGGVVKNLETHAKLGRGSLAIAETDESDRSLLFQTPEHAIVTNIEEDHHTTYKNIDEIKSTMLSFLEKVSPHGKAYICINDQGAKSLLGKTRTPIVTYGFSPDANVYAHDILLEENSSEFSINNRRYRLGIPGLHNVENALAAYALAKEFGLDEKHIKDKLATFQGAGRRFDFKGTFKGAEIFDDYAHHPTELACALQTAKKRAKGRLIAIFQPHKFSRTQALWNEFVECFDAAMPDILYITEIYAAGEAPMQGISGKILAQAIALRLLNTHVEYTATLDDAIKSLEKTLEANDLLITIGAGSVTQISKKLEIIQQS